MRNSKKETGATDIQLHFVENKNAQDKNAQERSAAILDLFGKDVFAKIETISSFLCFIRDMKGVDCDREATDGDIFLGVLNNALEIGLDKITKGLSKRYGFFNEEDFLTTVRDCRSSHDIKCVAEYKYISSSGVILNAILRSAPEKTRQLDIPFGGGRNA